MRNAEMTKSLAAMTPELAQQVHRMVLGGFGAHSIALETPATLQQVNAVFEWTTRYGNISPVNMAHGQAATEQADRDAATAKWCAAWDRQPLRLLATDKR